MRVHVHPGVLPLSGPEGAGKNQKVLTPAWGPTVRNDCLTCQNLLSGAQREAWEVGGGSRKRARRSQSWPCLLAIQGLVGKAILLNDDPGEQDRDEGSPGGTLGKAPDPAFRPRTKVQTKLGSERQSSG